MQRDILAGKSWSTCMTILGFILFLIVASVCSWIAEYFAPAQMPGGFWGAALAALKGGWIGEASLGRRSPQYGRVYVLPTILGATVLVFMLSLFSKGFARARRY